MEQAIVDNIVDDGVLFEQSRLFLIDWSQDFKVRRQEIVDHSSWLLWIFKELDILDQIRVKGVIFRP